MLQIRRFLPWPCSFLPSFHSIPPQLATTTTQKRQNHTGQAARPVPSISRLPARAHGAPYINPSTILPLLQPLLAAVAFCRLPWPRLCILALASRFHSSPDRARGGGDMRLLTIVGKSASCNSMSSAAPLPDDKDVPDRAGAVTVVAAGADHINGAVNGSKDESFFQARPWLDSDSEDDFYSVRGDFTPSRGSTPVHPRLTPSSGRMPVDRSGPSLVRKKQRLLELLQEEQHYDDEDDSVTDASSDLESSAVHAEEEEHVRTCRRSEKSKKPSGSGCFPTLIWKHSFTACRKKKKEKEQKDKANKHYDAKS